MSILNADYIITMPDDSKWKIPVSVIAEHRAKYYYYAAKGRAIDSGTSFDDIGWEKSHLPLTVDLFEADDYEAEDWAKNNMNWSDVESHAECVEKGNVHYEDGWRNGDVTIDPEDRDGV